MLTYCKIYSHSPKAVKARCTRTSSELVRKRYFSETGIWLCPSGPATYDWFRANSTEIFKIVVVFCLPRLLLTSHLIPPLLVETDISEYRKVPATPINGNQHDERFLFGSRGDLGCCVGCMVRQTNRLGVCFNRIQPYCTYLCVVFRVFAKVGGLFPIFPPI